MQRTQRKSFAHGLLVLGVNIRGVADIDGNGHAGVGCSQCLEETFTDRRPGVGFVVRQLYKKEGKVTLAPHVSPTGDQRGQQRLVVQAGRPAVRVAFALVPDGSTNRIRNQRLDHAIVECGRRILVAIRRRRQAGPAWSLASSITGLASSITGLACCDTWQPLLRSVSWPD